MITVLFNLNPFGFSELAHTPPPALRDYFSILSHPNAESMARFIRRGEQATWQHIESIRHTMAVETALQETAAVLTGKARAASRGSGGAGAQGRRSHTGLSSLG